MQIWQHNICNTNIITIKNIIILKKAKKIEKQSVNIANITMLSKIT